MPNATPSDFRQNQTQYTAAAQVEPAELRSRGAQTRVVSVPPAFYEKAMEAPEGRRDRQTRDGLDRWLREDFAQVVRDYEENPGDVYTLDEIHAEPGLK